MNTLISRFNGFVLMMLTIFLFPIVALAQTVGDIDIGTFVNQVVADAQTLHGLTGSALYLAAAAVLIRAVTSLIKVSFLRNLIKYDNWSNSIKMLFAPALGVLMIAVEIRPFTYQAVIVGLMTGVGAVAVHSLLDQIETLPGISSTVLFAIKLFGTLFGGDAPVLVAQEKKKIEAKRIARLAKKAA